MGEYRSFSKNNEIVVINPVCKIVAISDNGTQGFVDVAESSSGEKQLKSLITDALQRNGVSIRLFSPNSTTSEKYFLTLRALFDSLRYRKDAGIINQLDNLKDYMQVSGKRYYLFSIRTGFYRSSEAVDKIIENIVIGGALLALTGFSVIDNDSIADSTVYICIIDSETNKLIYFNYYSNSDDPRAKKNAVRQIKTVLNPIYPTK
jgi:hypothetical protein